MIGASHGCYPKTETVNLGRFISVMKFRPLIWQNTHPYVVADRLEDVTVRIQCIACLVHCVAAQPMLLPKYIFIIFKKKLKKGWCFFLCVCVLLFACCNFIDFYPLRLISFFLSFFLSFVLSFFLSFLFACFTFIALHCTALRRCVFVCSKGTGSERA